MGRVGSLRCCCGVVDMDAVVLSRIRDGVDVDAADDDDAAESCDGDDADATSLANAMDAVTIPLFADVLFR